MFSRFSQTGRRLAVALLCIGATAPVAAAAQETPQRETTVAEALRGALNDGATADHAQADEGQIDESQTGDSQTAEPQADDQLEYVLPSANAWQLTKPDVKGGTPVAVAAQPAIVDGLDGAVDEKPLSPEDQAILDKALALDAAEIAHDAPAKSLRLPGYANTDTKKLNVSRTDRPDGSGTVIVKKPLPIEWDAKVGADLGLAAAPAPTYAADHPLGVTNASPGSGAAWASLDVPHIATVDARVDPTADQGRVGTTFERSLPVGKKFAVKLRSSYSMTETLTQPQVSLADAPVSRVWGHEDVAKLDILPTGTTLGAGVSSSSIDPVTHNTLSAEQKVYGPLQVTTAVTDVGRTTESESLSARFKLTW